MPAKSLFPAVLVLGVVLLDVSSVRSSTGQTLSPTSRTASVPETSVQEIPALFFPSVPDPQGVQTSTSRFVDLDGDGNQDLLVAGDTTAGESPSPTIVAYKNDGKGHFTEVETGLTGVARGALDHADIDGDGDLDLVLTGDDGDGPSAAVYKNVGDTTGNGFPNFSPLDLNLTGVVAGTADFVDLEGDGDMDLVITGSTSADINNPQPLTTVLENDGTGNFTGVSNDLPGVAISSSDIADIDGDGDPDLVLTGAEEGLIAPQFAAAVYENDGSGSFSNVGAGSISGVGLGSSTFGDIDGDGDQDLVVTGATGSILDPRPSVAVYENDGEGGFTRTTAGLTEVAGSTSNFADLDGDGDQDLIVTGSTNASTDNPQPSTTVYENDGQGSFSEVTAGLYDVAVGSVDLSDIEGDGDQDLILGGRDDSGIPTAALYKDLAEGDQPVASASATIDSAQVVDFGDTGVDLRFDSTSGSGTVTVAKFSAPPADADDIETNVSAYRFVIGVSGSLDFDTTEVRLAVGTLAGISDPTAVRVQRRPRIGAGSFSALATTAGDGGTAEDISDDTLYADTDSFSEFVLTSDDPSNPLPVELAGFDATLLDGNRVRLTWRTTSERANSGFEVQRRRAGRSAGNRRASWEGIGFAPSKTDGSTASEPLKYRFTDPNPSYGTDSLVYRLKQIDTDGRASYSQEVALRRIPRELKLLNPFPNPARNQMMVRFAVPERRRVTLQIYDVLGRRVQTVLSETRKGYQEIRVEVSGLPSGIYFLRLSADGKVRTAKMTIAR